MAKIINTERRDPKVVSGKQRPSRERAGVERTPTPPVETTVVQPLTIQSLAERHDRIVGELIRQREVNETLMARIAQMDREISTITGEHVRMVTQNDAEHKFIVSKLQECMNVVPDIVNEQIGAIFTAIQQDETSDNIPEEREEEEEEKEKEEPSENIDSFEEISESETESV